MFFSSSSNGVREDKHVPEIHKLLYISMSCIVFMLFFVLCIIDLPNLIYNMHDVCCISCDGNHGIHSITGQSEIYSNPCGRKL